MAVSKDYRLSLEQRLPLLRLTEQASSSKSHFQSAFFLIPSKERRQALDDFYRYCRIVDDLADEEDLELSPGQRLVLLQQIEDWIKSPSDLGSDFWNRFGEQIQNYKYRHAALVGVIDGVRLDMSAQPLSIETWDDLNHYVQGVAVCVGEVVLSILGLSGPEADLYAQNLGRYVQYLNIMRDLDEDYALNRIYVPQEFIKSTGLEWSEELKSQLRAELYRRALNYRKQARAFSWRCLPCEALAGIYTYGAKKYWRFGKSQRLSSTERIIAVLSSLLNSLT